MAATASTGVHRLSALLVTAVASFLVALDALVVSTALPAIARTTGAGIDTLHWIVNAYTISCATGMIGAAALGDRYGRRRVFTAGLVLFTAASAGCALAQGTGWLLAARVAQGLGAAAVTPLSLTILTTAFPPARRGMIVGIWAGLGGLAVASGPVLGGAVTHAWGWHWVFWLNVPVGLAAATVSRLRLAESHGTRTRVDAVGIVLLAGAAFAVTWGLIHAGRTGWTDPAGAVALTAGAAAVGSFLLWQRRTDQPTIPLHLLRNPGFTAAATVLALSAATVSAATFLIAQYFQDGRGDSPLQAGLHMLPWTAAPLLIAPAAGRLSDHLGRRPVLVVGMLAQAGGLAWFALLTGPRHAETPPAVPLLIAGLGISLVLPTATAGALDGLPPHHVGTAAGVTATTQRLGGVIGIAAAATVFAGHGDLHTPAAFAAGFRPALLLAAGFSVLGALTALARHARCEVGGDLAGAGALTPLAR